MADAGLAVVAAMAAVRKERAFLAAIRANDETKVREALATMPANWLRQNGAGAITLASSHGAYPEKLWRLTLTVPVEQSISSRLQHGMMPSTRSLTSAATECQSRRDGEARSQGTHWTSTR